MTKKLNEEAIQNELRGGSVFFPAKGNARQSLTKVDKDQSVAQQPLGERPAEANMQPYHLDTVVSRHHDEQIEVIRKAVRQQGKEAATYRFTRDEKKALAEVVYACRNKDIRTSENEITGAVK